MPVWRKHIALKDLLGEDESTEAVRDAAAGMAARLMALPEYKAQDDSELESIVTEFEDIANPNNPPEMFSGRLSLCTYFNDVLHSLYDWADSERIWIE